MKIEHLTTPQKMRADINEESDIMAHKFEEQFKKEEKGEKYYHLVIEGEYSREACNRIETCYKAAGWQRAICQTSSENGERPGLTGLQLYTKAINDLGE